MLKYLCREMTHYVSYMYRHEVTHWSIYLYIQVCLTLMVYEQMVNSYYGQYLMGTGEIYKRLSQYSG